MPKCSAVISLANIYDGASGRGVSSTSVTYQSSSSGTTAPTGTWNSTIPSVSAGNYLWTRTVVTYTDGTSSTLYSVGKMGDTGAKGDKGDTGSTGATGATGNGISTIVNYYLATASSSGVTASTSGWTTAVQAVTAAKKYLWNYEKVTYTNGSSTSSSPCIIGTYGDKGDTGSTGSTGAAGKGISSIVEYYALSTSASSVTGSWQTSVPTLTASNKYLWNYEKITYTDSTVTSTSQHVIGVYGDTGATGSTGATGTAGNGISSITYTYAVTSTQTQPSSITSASIPSTYNATNKYLWQQEVIAFTGSSSKTTVALIGVWGSTGATGATGQTGATGNGISSITYYYATTTSQTAPSAVTSPSIPALSATNKYLWQKEVIAYTDGTSKTTTALIGTYGDTGAKGNTGAKGDTGASGADAVSAELSISSIQIPVNVSGNVKDAMTVECVFSGYKGTTSQTCTATVGTLPSGITASVNNTSRTITFTIAKNGTLGNSLAGLIAVSVTVLGVSFTKKISWIKTVDAQSLQTEIEAQADDITSINGSLSGLATRVTSSEGKISANATSITNNAEAIKLKASKTSVDTLTGEVNQNTASITTNADNITSLVTKTDNTNSRVDDAEGNITTAQSSIRQNADAINLKVSAIGENGATINDAKIDVSVAEDGSHILLDADKVLISGSIKADKIDVTDLMAHDLVIGNSIHSDKYLEDGSVNPDLPEAASGFYVNAEGKVKAKDAEFDSVSISGTSTFSGSIKNNFLITRAFSDSNESYTLTTTRNWWYESTLYSLISPKGVNSIIGASGTFNGVALSHVICCNSTGAYILLKASEAIGFGQTKQWTSTINGRISVSFTAPEWTGTVRDYYWDSTSESGGGRFVPSSQPRPSNPSVGTSYYQISNVEQVAGDSPATYTWTKTTYTYTFTETEDTGQVYCSLKKGTTEIYNGSSGYRVGIDVSKGSVISLIAGSTSDSLHANGDWKIDIKFDSTGVKFIDTNGTISHVKSSAWYKTSFSLSSPVSTSSSAISAKFSPNADFFAPNKALAVMYSLDPSSRIAGKVAVSFMKIDASHVVLQYLDGSSLKSLSIASSSMLDENFGGTIKIANTPGGIDVGTILPLAPTDNIGSAEKPFNEVRATNVYGNVNSQATSSSVKVWRAVAN